MNIEIKDLKRFAQKEDWAKVDRILPRICNQPIYINWAIVDGIKDKNPNIRDLAASLLEKATIPESEFIRVAQDLKVLMDHDAKLYSGFRAACALAAHKPIQYPDEVIKVLSYFENNSDVKSIAKSYLRRVKNRA